MNSWKNVCWYRKLTIGKAPYRCFGSQAAPYEHMAIPKKWLQSVPWLQPFYHIFYTSVGLFQFPVFFIGYCLAPFIGNLFSRNFYCPCLRPSCIESHVCDHCCDLFLRHSVIFGVLKMEFQGRIFFQCFLCYPCCPFAWRIISSTTISKTSPTELSDIVKPFLSAFVLSAINANIPSFPSSAILPKSIILPSIGV